MSDGNYVLGISAYFHDSAAALVQGDRIIAAAQEERFSRQKGDWRFPHRAIGFCLEQLPPGATLDLVAYYENPALKVDRIVHTAVATAPRGAALWPRSVKLLHELTVELPARLKEILPDPSRIRFSPHHRSHAAAAFYPSPFEQAAVLVIDGVGEWSSTTLWSAKDGFLKPVGEIRFPHSLGMFFSAFTQYCGFKVNSGESKLMGLAPFGKPLYRDLILDNLIDLKPDGSFSLDMAYFDFETNRRMIGPVFERLFGQPSRHPESPISPHFMNVAASAQVVLEEAVLRLAATALDRTGQQDLCFAGGAALNCMANRRLALEVPALENLWIQPAAGDAGGALGAALEVANSMGTGTKALKQENNANQDKMAGSYLGPSFTDDQIEQALNQTPLTFEKPISDSQFALLAAQSLSDGEILGHFDGRMEFGPRALGNRSILADPRQQNMMRRVNRRIKFREDWRPFAPMILEHRAAEFFSEPNDSPYMLLVSTLKPQFRHATTVSEVMSQGQHEPFALQTRITSDYSAVTHVDFSARLQTIGPELGGRAYRLVKAFEDLTGCPMLLNTSFNVRGEPIVCTPQDAIACFLNTHMDCLAIGPYFVRKSSQGDWVKREFRRSKFAAD